MDTTSERNSEQPFSPACMDEGMIRLLNLALVLFYFAALTAAASWLSVYYVPFSIIPDFNAFRAIASIALIVLIVWHPNPTARSGFDLCLYIVFLLTFVPALCVWSLGFGEAEWVLGQAFFWLILFAMNRRFSWRLTLPRIIGGRILALAVIIICLSYSFGALYLRFGLPGGIDLVDVYGRRGEFKAAGIPFINYALTWSMYVVLPTLFFYSKGIWRAVLSILAFILIVYAFMVTGHKTYLVIIPLTGFLIWLSGKRQNAMLCAAGLIAIVMFSSGLAIWLDDRIVYGVFVNRGLVLPAVISFQYFDFFSYHGTVSLAHSVLSGLANYPWTDEPAQVIGGVFYFVGNNANTGIVGDSYANFGYLGLAMLLMALLLLRGLVDGVSRGEHLALASIGFPMLVWGNIPFLTSLLTGGLALGLLLVWLNQGDETG